MNSTIFMNRPASHIDRFWNAVHFHPTDAIEDEWGQKILNRIAEDGAAQTVRMYAMLEDCVSMGEDGKLRYDFTLNDTRMDYMVQKGFRLLLSYNFIPPCIAEKPDVCSSVSKNKTRYKGKMIVTSRPADYGLWEEICREYTRHIVERYGEKTVSTWYLQCYNEPDVPAFFLGDLPETDEATMERLREYRKLYRGFANGIGSVSKKLCIGGPALAWHYDFLEGFLDTVIEEGLQLDYVTAHSYGTEPPKLNAGDHIDTAKNLERIRTLREIVDRKLPGKKIPLVIDEWGAATCGFWNVEECPALLYRESNVMAAFYGKLVTELVDQNVAPEQLMICLSGQHEMTEDFSGFRNLFTLHGIRKPIYNAYCLMSHLGEERIPSETDEKNLRILATKAGGKLTILLTYASEDFSESIAPLHERIRLEGPAEKNTVTVYRIDSTHTNPYGIFLRKGYCADLTEAQLRELNEEGELKPCEMHLTDGTLELTLYPNSLTLLEM